MQRNRGREKEGGEEKGWERQTGEEAAKVVT